MTGIERSSARTLSRRNRRSEAEAAARGELGGAVATDDEEASRRRPAWLVQIAHSDSPLTRVRLRSHVVHSRID
jgi:hypothetical protein